MDENNYWNKSNTQDENSFESSEVNEVFSALRRQVHASSPAARSNSPSARSVTPDENSNKSLVNDVFSSLRRQVHAPRSGAVQSAKPVQPADSSSDRKALFNQLNDEASSYMTTEELDA